MPPHPARCLPSHVHTFSTRPTPAWPSPQCWQAGSQTDPRRSAQTAAPAMRAGRSVGPLRRSANDLGQVGATNVGDWAQACSRRQAGTAELSGMRRRLASTSRSTCAQHSASRCSQAPVGASCSLLRTRVVGSRVCQVVGQVLQRALRAHRQARGWVSQRHRSTSQHERGEEAARAAQPTLPVTRPCTRKPRKEVIARRAFLISLTCACHSTQHEAA